MTKHTTDEFSIKWTMALTGHMERMKMRDRASLRSIFRYFLMSEPAFDFSLFSHEYVGLDVHQVTIAVAVADTGTAEPRALGTIPTIATHCVPW